jgi:predicted ATPase/class 3 adenylate cyclase
VAIRPASGGIPPHLSQWSCQLIPVWLASIGPSSGDKLRLVGLPSGTVTFLFTDIEGSTRMWESAPEAMRGALERHDQIVGSAAEQNHGFVFGTAGDGFSVAFARVGDAIAAASVTQAALAEEPWPEGAAIRVRMGLHTGEAVERNGDYFGTEVNRAARLMAVAHGGQVICSQSTAALAHGDPSIRSLGQHRLRDLAAALEVFQIGEGTFPPLRSVDAVPTNLPTMRTELIGRSDDVSSLAKLVERERLVTLTGVGGVGKTRLALGVAASVAPDFADGCWLVELAAAASGEDIVKIVASGVRAPTTNTADLSSYLEARRMLIVLDNCEHVLDGVSGLVDELLARAPDIHVLVTSREPLGLDGEQVRRVPSLALPAVDAALDQIQAAPAVRLFAERAGAVAEGFTIDGNAEAVTEICRHLDGIPLAIELAAALVRAMPPEEIAKRLGERFRLLAGGSRRSQERQRTLLATVAWSHDLLSEHEKGTFRRLAVFPASFDLAAAEAVAEEEGNDVVACVLHLVDRSLVTYEPEAGRYRLLETLRQYAADRLAEAGETDANASRHARYYLAFVQRLVPTPDHANDLERAPVLTLELDNLRVTADWCIESGAWAELAGFCDRLKVFFFQHVPVDAAAWYSRLIDHASALDDQVVVDTLGAFAYLQVLNFGNYAAVAELYKRSNELAAEQNCEESDLAWTAAAQSGMFTGSLSSERLLSVAEHALALAEARRDETAALHALSLAATVLSRAGETERSAELTSEVLARAERSGWPLFIAPSVVTAAGINLWTSGEPDFASSLEVLTVHPVELHGGGLNALWLDITWGTTLLGMGQPAAIEYLARAAGMADQLNAAPALDLVLRLLAIAAAEAGLRPQAMSLAAYAETHLRPYRIAGGQGWIDTRQDRALGDLRHASQSAMHRSELMALVGEVDAALRQTL